jgi:CRISPR/Cas system CSM-associated protein Csm3 (group 7 of RAMP superfamily)
MGNEKPFVYMNLKKPDKEKIIGHERINQRLQDEKEDHETETGKITFILKVTSEYFFVGDGQQKLFNPYEHFSLKNSDKTHQEPYYTFCRSQNNPTIPGSSLKGAIRCYAEAISNSCVSIQSKIDKEIEKLNPPCTFDEHKKLCPCCRIFGTTDYQGHVSFSDALLTDGSKPEIIKVHELFEPQEFEEKKRKNKLRNEIPKRKFFPKGTFEKLNDYPRESHRYIEAFPKNSKFFFDIFFVNIFKKDLSLIFHSMGINQGFEIKVGGAKPRCLGNVSFEANSVTLIDALFNEHVEDPKEFVEERLKYSGLVKNIVELKNKISSKSKCPEENY